MLNTANDPITSNLEVQGELTITNPLDNTANRGSKVNFAFDDGIGGTIAIKRDLGLADTDSYMAFRVGGGTGGQEKMRITPDGNVGIGGIAPTAKLEISEPVDSTTPAKMRFVNEGDRGVTVGFTDHDTAPNFSISNGDGSNNFLNITSGGLVGIGASDNPTSLLEISSQFPKLTVRSTETSVTTASAAFRLAESGPDNTLGGYWDLVADQTAATGLFNFSIKEGSNPFFQIRSGEGWVGVGPNTPRYPFDITDETRNIVTARLASGADNNFQLVASNGPTTNQSGIEIFRLGSYYKDTGWNTHLLWTRGNDALTGDLLVRSSAGEIARFRAAGGITFNGDSVQANALDDYEEGLWTPTIVGSDTAGTVTYTRQVGTYTKIGRMILLQCQVTWTGGVGGVGGLRVTGLPFNSLAGSDRNNFVGAYAASISTMAANATAYAYFPRNSDYIGIDHYVAPGAGTSTPWAASGNFGVNITYQTN